MSNENEMKKFSHLRRGAINCLCLLTLYSHLSSPCSRLARMANMIGMMEELYYGMEQRSRTNKFISDSRTYYFYTKSAALYLSTYHRASHTTTGSKVWQNGFQRCKYTPLASIKSFQSKKTFYVYQNFVVHCYCKNAINFNIMDK